MPIIAGRASAAYGAGFGAITAPPYEGPFGAFDALSTVTVGATAVSEIYFLGVPTGYKHLQIRGSILGSSLNDDVLAQFNGVTASNNYALHELRGNGSTVTSGSGVNGTAFYVATNALDTTSPTVFIMDVLDYASTSKNKTSRVLQGKDSNGGGTLSLFSGLYHGTTNAITSIRIYAAGGNFNQHSSFALYGVK
jgi:hypothetical protein